MSLIVKDVQNTVTLLLCKIQNLQDPTTTCSSWIHNSQDTAKSVSVLDTRSLRSHGSIAVTGSKIFRISRENENIGSKIPQDPARSWIMGIRISDPFGILAHFCPGHHKRDSFDGSQSFFLFHVYLCWIYTAFGDGEDGSTSDSE